MPSSISRACVIGDGAMGTLCALLLADHGAAVTLWGASPAHVEMLRRDRVNNRYLPGHPFPSSLRVVSDPESAFDEPELIVSAVPTQYIRPVWMRLAANVPRTVPIVSVAKGLELDTLLLPTEIIRDCLGEVPLGCLSGPSIAPEVAQKKPASLVAASGDKTVAQHVQAAFSTDYLRVYTSSDLKGVELAGAVKNVIAIAAGICDGIGAGDNTKAALLTRGLVEITRLGVALGASAETFHGLAGVGDLYTTCASRIGRNRTAGEQIGRGGTVQEVIASTPSVIEGISTTKSVIALANQCGVNMPIVFAVGSVLFGDCRPEDAIASLMTRPLRSE